MEAQKFQPCIRLTCRIDVWHCSSASPSQSVSLKGHQIAATSAAANTTRIKIDDSQFIEPLGIEECSGRVGEKRGNRRDGAGTIRAATAPSLINGLRQVRHQKREYGNKTFPEQRLSLLRRCSRSTTVHETAFLIREVIRKRTPVLVALVHGVPS
jgi:hypothetical protein